MLFLAIGGIGDGTDGQDDFYQAVLHTNYGYAILRPIHLPRFRFPTKSRVCPRNLPKKFSKGKAARASVNRTGMRSRRTSSVGKQLCRIANGIGGASRHGTCEATGLDIERKRAMFRRCTCLDFADWACADSGPHPLTRNFRTDEGLSKAAVIFQAQIKN